MHQAAFFRHCFQTGFTLIEVFVTLAVVAVLSLIAIPSFHALIDIRRTEGAASQLVSDIQFARFEAAARNHPLRLTFQTTEQGTCYVLHAGSPLDCTCIPSGNAAHCRHDAEGQPIKTVRWASSDGIRVSANARSFLFDPLHGTSTPAGTLEVTSSRGRAIHHVMNIMGRVRSCSPRASVPGYPVC